MAKKRTRSKTRKAHSSSFFEQFSSKVIAATGSSWAFMIALGLIIIWGISGPIFGYSDTWQLVINTSTTIITFLMVFLIQKAQNKDSKSIQLKLNELIAASLEASNRLIDVEDLTEEELDTLHKYYSKLADEIKKKIEIKESHSIDEAMERVRKKMEPKS
ncbi:low affinity Fe/Cu permease [Chitinophaga skermanii]|uniref:Low affinity Fe/Cu permease n=1 Tax=Chitinophaga skermanii TaxID=331697 RepID=A0A327QAF3_9BACT|nr:low affinity iron permease family protein [Chitinophaga skermanii]RAJ01616.1 low affinity Fe/Cu permease [Chitinophaga skermanii]